MSINSLIDPHNSTIHHTSSSQLFKSSSNHTTKHIQQTHLNPPSKMSSSTYIQLYNLRWDSPLADFLTELEELLTFYEYPECLVMEEECPICAEHHGQSKIQVPCGHIFHTDCLITWLLECQNNARDGTCPMCRGLFWVQAEYEAVYEETTVAATSTLDNSSPLGICKLRLMFT